MLGYLLLTLVVVLGALLVVALLPMRLRFHAGAPPQRARVDLHLLDGAAPAIKVLELPSASKNAPDNPHKQEAGVDTPARTPRRRKRRLDASAWQDLLALLAEVPDALRLIEARGDLTFGLDDPADTGTAFGLLTPLVYGVPSGEPYGLTVTPVFDGPYLAGDVTATVRIHVLRFAWIAIRAAGVVLRARR